ncbi:methionyl-tRNA formyltransferase [Pseudonocardia thermophila]|uniref:Methionyl-tRNA formyltransferase n=1 Tax=Pseudonocardia thermophila TaxID=1848 RepID=A0A1M7B189_PSETH|nr:formyltransferase family protein [Pseudonocardia thermophila]SHL48745.1 methionyl-tRNA formyltransferase [Pseudonocardia thermophila]
MPARARSFLRRETSDVNELAGFIAEICTDGLVCSTGNPFIFRAPILDLGLTIVNIHGGPLPGYRGLPVVAATFAILRGEREYGVTLHRVDAGIDTGPVVDRRTFPLPDSVTLEELLVQVTNSCHQLFTDNLADLGREPLAPAGADGEGEYFGKARLAELAGFRDHPAFERATDLGVLADFHPDYAAAFEAARSGAPVG